MNSARTEEDRTLQISNLRLFEFMKPVSVGTLVTRLVKQSAGGGARRRPRCQALLPFTPPPFASAVSWGSHAPDVQAKALENQSATPNVAVETLPPSRLGRPPARVQVRGRAPTPSWRRPMTRAHHHPAPALASTSPVPALWRHWMGRGRAGPGSRRPRPRPRTADVPTTASESRGASAPGARRRLGFALFSRV